MTQLEFNNALVELQDKLFYYALSLTADSDNANDLLQETLLKALSNQDKYIDNTNLKAWMYTIMKNTFINDYRRNKKTRTTFDVSDRSFFFADTGEGFHSPESAYSSKEIFERIVELEDDFRIPFSMFLDGYKYKEIAEELNLPLGTVKSRIFFTRKKLEKSMSEYSLN